MSTTCHGPLRNRRLLPSAGGLKMTGLQGVDAPSCAEEKRPVTEVLHGSGPPQVLLGDRGAARPGKEHDDGATEALGEQPAEDSRHGIDKLRVRLGRQFAYRNQARPRGEARGTDL
jgi:hypothetical protein